MKKLSAVPEKSILRKKFSAMGIGIAAAGMLLAACGSGSSSASTSSSSGSSSTTSASSSAAAYFKGKTITLIAPDNPGGDFDLYARIVAPALGKYLGATVNVENVNGGGTVVGTNQMAAAKPNGLTLGVVNFGGDEASIIEKKTGQNFNLAKLSYIGQPGSSPSVFITQPNSGFASFKQLLSVKTPIKVVDVRNGTGDMMNRVVLGAFNIPHTFITGFTSVSALKQGFLAGDGQFAFENLPPFRSMLDGGQAKALLTTFEPTLASLKKAVGSAITLNQALKLTTLTSAQSAAVKEALALSNVTFDFAGPAGIPSARLAVLRAAFKKALADPSTIAAAAKEGEPLSYTSGSTVTSEVQNAIAQASTISTYVNG